MSGPHVDLRLPDSERCLVAALLAPWRDLLYAPGPEFTSPLDAGAYRSSLVIVPETGPAVRVSSLVTPAFAGELCRLRLEALPHHRPESLGSYFEPGRAGTVYALAPERGGAAGGPDRAEWRYGGISLAPRLGRISGIRLLRERGGGADCSWEADRGLVLTGADGADCLVLAAAELAEAALFLPSPGLYRALVDTTPARQPGVTVRDLLGHGDRDDGVDITIELLAV
ncbi:MAG: hypothetical protein ACREJE_05440 [Candidatus Rokuibacteriota bacterium]